MPGSIRDAAVIGIYLALPAEVQTDALIERCRTAGKTVCVPSWDDTAAAYRWVRWQPGGGVRRGPDRVLEPIDPLPVPARLLDVAVVPGVAFDPEGHRLGRGGGHLDRLLEDLRPETVKIALAFDFQRVDRLPVEPHDVAMDIVISETHTTHRTHTTD